MDASRTAAASRGARWPALVGGLIFLVTGCGGPNEADVALITGESADTPAAGATATRSAAPTPTPTPTLAVRAASVHFVSASPPAIGVRESGLPEQSVLTFQVTDANGNPAAGVPVRFTLTGVGDESIQPEEATTDGEGMARTTVTAGARASSVRVVAAADADGDGVFELTAQSTQVAVLGAVPAQNRFSVAAQKLNVAGRVFFGIRNPIMAFVNDRFGNAVPPGTAVTFISNGASVVNAQPTDADGVATATLITEAEVPPTGIVTVIAFTRGEEAFLDTNGNGRFDAGADGILNDDQPEPFVDFRPLPSFLSLPPNDAACSVRPPSWLCNAGFDPRLPFELFVDANSNGIWDAQGEPGVWDTNILIFDVIPVTFSGHLVPPRAQPDTFSIPNGGAQSFDLAVHDDLLNPLVGGSTITVTSNSGAVTGGSITVPDGESFNQLVNGFNLFSFVVSDDDPDDTNPPVAANILVTVTSENGNGSFVVATGTID